jgi:hypothetical protein
VIGWVAGAAALAAVTAALASVAQHAAVVAARPETADLYTYSLVGHVAAITLLGCAAVFVASVLRSQGHLVLSAVVVVATGFGTMTVVAVPLRWSLVASSSGDTVWWWHLVVGTVVVAVLGVWCHVVAPAPTPDAPRRRPSPDMLFVLVATVAFVGCWNFSWQLQESPGVLPALGWAALAAGGAVAASTASWRVPLVALVLTGVALAVMAWAYLRQGGWPTVAGWEFNGMESPVVLSARVCAVALAGPVAGALLRMTSHAIGHRRHAVLDAVGV